MLSMHTHKKHAEWLQNIFILFLLFSIGCGTAHSVQRANSKGVTLQQKLSPRVSAWIERVEAQHDTTSNIDVVLSLNDTTGIRAVIPKIVIANAAVATLSATSSDIRTLCSLKQILYIEISKQFFPKKDFSPQRH